MSARSFAAWRAFYVARGQSFPLDGPALPPGWAWVCGIPGSAPHRAEHEHAHLSIILGGARRYPEKRTWRVKVKDRTLRAGKEGPLREFADPAEAAREAVAAFTGARIGIVVNT